MLSFARETLANTHFIFIYRTLARALGWYVIFFVAGVIIVKQWQAVGYFALSPCGCSDRGDR